MPDDRAAVGTNHRQLGVHLFNDVWRFLEKAARTTDEDDELVHQAHASAYHWLKAPECEPKNRARSEWLCSRVYAVLGRAEPALHHATRCLEITLQHAATSRTGTCPSPTRRSPERTGPPATTESRAATPSSRVSGESIADPEDREHFVADLTTLT